MQHWLNRLSGFLDDWLVKVYSSPRAAVRGLFLFPLYTLRRILSLLPGGLTFEVYALEGQVQGGADRLRVLYFAEGHGMKFLASRLFEDGYQCEQLPNVRAWRLVQAATRQAQQADLVVVERNTLLGWAPASGAWLSVPTWVRMVRDLDPTQPWEQVEQSFKKHERNIRRVKRSGFSYEISREPADFDFFFERMYSPFVLGRHKGYGLLDSREHLRSLFAHGFLLFILDAQGRRVAADLAALYGDVYFGVASGVLDNDPALLDAGVISALYYDALQWCHANRIRRCDIGEARPFELDGLYQYKRRWGYAPARELWNPREWLFWAPGESPAALHWLHNNPTVAEFTRANIDPPPGLLKEMG